MNMPKAGSKTVFPVTMISKAAMMTASEDTASVKT